MKHSKYALLEKKKTVSCTQKQGTQFICVICRQWTKSRKITGSRGVDR